MANFQWPDAKDRDVIGTRVERVDGPDKVAGHAKYSFDLNPKGLLFGTMVRSPYAHCKVTAVDTSAAEKLPRQSTR